MFVRRDHDIFNGDTRLEHLHTFDDFPVYMGVTTEPAETDLRADMSWWISPSTGSIQLNPCLELATLYAQSHGSGSVGALWTRHHQSFGRFLAKFNPSRVLEVGGGHGRLASEYLRTHDISWTIVEPNPSDNLDPRIQVVKNFFSKDLLMDYRPDTVVHSHVFEHMYEPFEFVKDLSSFTRSGDQVIFTLPNMAAMLRRGYVNCLNFEHTTLLVEDYIEAMMSAVGFELLDREYFEDDHSIFYAWRNTGIPTSSGVTLDLYAAHKELFLSYLDSNRRIVLEINSHLETVNTAVFLFGAHVFSQYLLAFGLRSEKIQAILDNDPTKQGKRLTGTNLIVRSPAVLAGLDEPVVVLRAGVYNDEIRQQILGSVNPSTRFLE